MHIFKKKDKTHKITKPLIKIKNRKYKNKIQFKMYSSI